VWELHRIEAAPEGLTYDKIFTTGVARGQRAITRKQMEKLQTVLIEEMSTQERAEELAWFMSSATPVGSLWLSVVPFGYNGKVPYHQLSSQQRFEIDRMTLRLNKAELQHALSERLRLPVVDGYTCPMAATEAGRNEHVHRRHLTTCASLGKTQRHNQMRDAMLFNCRNAGLTVSKLDDDIRVATKYNPLPTLTAADSQAASQLKSDLAVSRLRSTGTKQHTVFLDVTIITPDESFKRQSSTKKEIPVGAAAAKAEADKAAKYSQFEEPGPSNCVTIAVEAAGYIGADTDAFLDEIARYARPNVENPESTKLTYEANLFRYECLQRMSIFLRKGQAALHHKGLVMHTKGTAEFRAKFDLAKTRRDAKLPDHTDKDTPAPRRRGPGRVAKAKQQAAPSPKPASNNAMADDVSSLDSDSPEAVRRSTRVRTRTGTAGPGV
jgi:hypothetical protein